MSEPVADWARLLIEAVEKPGIIADAYRLFWNAAPPPPNPPPRVRKAEKSEAARCLTN